MTRVALLFATGTEECEALNVADILRRAGMDLSIVSISSDKKVTGSHDITIIADELIEDHDFSKDDVLVIPGGMPGTTNLGACKALTDKIKEFDEKDKMLCAICAAPTVFGGLGILKGKKACCFPGREKDLLGADVQTTPVTKDGHFITSRGMGTAMDFGLAIIEHYQGIDAATSMASKIVYKV